jgi:Ca2+-binding EF-hand superfamily protein
VGSQFFVKGKIFIDIIICYIGYLFIRMFYPTALDFYRSKSEKLGFSFDLMDDDKDSMLTKRGLWRFFRSFLCVLLTLSGALADLSVEEANGILDDSAVWTSSEILGSAGNDNARLISFEAIADWYSEIGYTSATWLELLDLKKWLPLTGDQDTGGFQVHSQLQDVDDIEDDLNVLSMEDSAREPTHQLLFRIRLVGNELLLRQSDADRTRIMLSVMYKLCSMDSLDLIMQLYERVDAGTSLLSLQSFEDFILLFMRSSNAENYEISRNVLMNIFKAFDPTGKGAVYFPAFATGMTVLSGGSKSHKLDVGFKLFDGDGVGYLSSLELSSFLESYLKTINALSNSSSISDDVIEGSCYSLACSICGSEPHADFASFSGWYNAGGHQEASWIELIDLAKWIDIPNGATGQPYHAQHAPVGSASLDNSERITLGLGRKHGDSSISISKLSAARVYQFSSILGIKQIPPEDASRLFMSEADDGLISVESFDECIRSITAKSGRLLSVEEKEEYSIVLHSLFFSFDRTGSGEFVDVTDLCAGFSILCGGTKSEKLGFAFEIFDEDGDGFLSKRGLWRYFRSFLCALLTLSDALSDASSEEANSIIDAASRRVCDSVCANLSTSETRVSFDDIAQWYSFRCEEFPWLELLDLNKWKLLAQN